MDKLLEQEILQLSNQLNQYSDTCVNAFVVYCNEAIKDVIGESFKIANYSYDVVILSADALQETQDMSNKSQSNIWITAKHS